MIERPAHFFQSSETQQEQSRQSFAALLVSLYLVLLAFFIMLNALSEYNASRQFRAVSSVKGTFSSPKNTPTHAENKEKAQQDAQLVDQFYRELMEILAPLTSQAETRMAIHPDHVILTMPLSFFYAPLQSEFRTERLWLWKKLAEFAARQQANLPFDIAFLVGSSIEPDNLPLLRAGTWARSMQSFHAPASRIMAGQDDGLDALVELRITLRKGYVFNEQQP